MLDLESYLALRERPAGKPVMFQEWRDLTFLHLPMEPNEVQTMLPKGLTVDTFPDASGREMAWMGLVPFWMRGIRPRVFPSLPWISTFPETNVRAYVHRDGREPGVWFFSLDAARKLACVVARATFQLPYWWSRMSVGSRDGVVRYRSRRIEGPARPELEIQARPVGSVRLAEPGSFDFFLVERYLLYAEKAGRLFTGRVWHEPYLIQDVELLNCHQTFLGSSDWVHLAFSPGVNVDVYPIHPS
ncbi:MAG TPA: DUF2071 domain-containing protein [Fimbriimonadaceae bacterium]|nr:DUF2071 domain-containing protein [Fimbriimonadaceae bacterium]HRJ34069.1 DUF2071 domain-containing protein [Fimbriimonadaceae bacterium]